MRFKFIRINTTETGEYQNTTVTWWSAQEKKETKVFATNDVCRDFLDCLVFCDILEDEKTPVMFSSSVDHWSFDNDGYAWSVVEVDGRLYETIVRV